MSSMVIECMSELLRRSLNFKIVCIFIKTNLNLYRIIVKLFESTQHTPAEAVQAAAKHIVLCNIFAKKKDPPREREKDTDTQTRFHTKCNQ